MQTRLGPIQPATHQGNETVVRTRSNGGSGYHSERLGECGSRLQAYPAEQGRIQQEPVSPQPQPCSWVLLPSTLVPCAGEPGTAAGRRDEHGGWAQPATLSPQSQKRSEGPELSRWAVTPPPVCTKPGEGSSSPPPQQLIGKESHGLDRPSHPCDNGTWSGLRDILAPGRAPPTPPGGRCPGFGMT